MKGLMLHCGAEPMGRTQIAELETPEPMGSRHCPVPFIDFIDTTTQALNHVGLQVLDEAYGALKDGSRFFGLMEIAGYSGIDSDFAMTVGLRASHDQSFARGVCVGSHVFVCDNLCFSGEISLTTRHTTNINSRLPGMVLEAVQTLPGHFEVQNQRFDQYKLMELKPRWGDAALTELVRREVLNPSQIGRAIREWDEPTHPEHGEDGHSVWRLMNAVTETMKAPLDSEGRPTRAAAPATMTRTIGLTKFLDEIVDFKPNFAHAA